MVLLVDDLLIIMFNGLLKIYCVVGYCFGWMVIFGNKFVVKDYLEGIIMLVFMCLCFNVLGQLVIQIVLGGY